MKMDPFKRKMLGPDLEPCSPGCEWTHDAIEPLVPYREILKTATYGLGFQHLPQDLANVNAWKTMFDPYIIPSLPENANFTKINFAMSMVYTDNRELNHLRTNYRFQKIIALYH